jgi:hypothetical protein
LILQETYIKSPPEHYVAALFDDVNELYIDGEKKLIYPHQIQASKDFFTQGCCKKIILQRVFLVD